MEALIPSKRRANAWNEFQRQHKTFGWDQQKMKMAYQEHKRQLAFQVRSTRGEDVQQAKDQEPHPKQWQKQQQQQQQQRQQQPVPVFLPLHTNGLRGPFDFNTRRSRLTPFLPVAHHKTTIQQPQQPQQQQDDDQGHSATISTRPRQGSQQHGSLQQAGRARSTWSDKASSWVRGLTKHLARSPSAAATAGAAEPQISCTDDAQRRSLPGRCLQAAQHHQLPATSWASADTVCEGTCQGGHTAGPSMGIEAACSSRSLPGPAGMSCVHLHRPAEADPEDVHDRRQDGERSSSHRGKPRSRVKAMLQTFRRALDPGSGRREERKIGRQVGQGHEVQAGQSGGRHPAGVGSGSVGERLPVQTLPPAAAAAAAAEARDTGLGAVRQCALWEAEACSADVRKGSAAAHRSVPPPPLQQARHAFQPSSGGHAQAGVLKPITPPLSASPSFLEHPSYTPPVQPPPLLDYGEATSPFRPLPVSNLRTPGGSPGKAQQGGQVAGGEAETGRPQVQPSLGPAACRATPSTSVEHKRCCGGLCKVQAPQEGMQALRAAQPPAGPPAAAPVPLQHAPRQAEQRPAKKKGKPFNWWEDRAVPDAQVAALPDYRPYSNGGGLRVRAREHVPDSHDRYFNGFTHWLEVAPGVLVNSVRRQIPRAAGLYEWGARAPGSTKVWAFYLGQSGDSGKLKLNRETLRSRFYKYSNSALPWLGPLTETCTLKACIFRELQRKGFTLYYRWCACSEPEQRETYILREIDYAGNSRKNNHQQRQPFYEGGRRLVDYPLVQQA